MIIEELVDRATVQLPGGYRTWPPPLGTNSITLEDAEFLTALIRVAKPLQVLETGTGLGVSARFIAEALKENGRGHLHTWEPYKEWADQARPLLVDLPVTINVGKPRVTHEPDLVFLDSGPGIRAPEIRRWLSSRSRALIVVHDANREYPELAFGVGTFIPGSDGFWLGRSGAL